MGVTFTMTFDFQEMILVQSGLCSETTASAVELS
jgi:hypothetical protein